MQAFPNTWSLKDKIEYLQRKILLNCIAYYMYNLSPLSDKDYDGLAHQLLYLSREYTGDILNTRYGYAMHDFDGNTGFDLFYRLTDDDQQYLLDITRHTLKV